MADARRMAELSMPVELAKEVKTQIEAAASGVTPDAANVTVATFTTAGGTEVSGTLQEVLEALGDLADPAA